MTPLEGIFYFLAAMAILLFMITIHELGHYTAGKILGFKINEFAIGMGPAIFKRKSKKTGEIFSIRIIPLGGYCAFKDEAGIDTDKQSDKTEADSADKQTEKQITKPAEKSAPDPDSFTAQKPWKRLIVFVAGAAFNFISAIIIVIFAFAVFGSTMPAVYDIVDGTGAPVTSAAWEAKQEAERIAEENGTAVDYSHCLLKDDIILEVNGHRIFFQSDLSKYLAESGNDDTTVLVVRDGQKVLLTGLKKKVYAAPKLDDDGNVVKDENDQIVWQYSSAAGLGIYLGADHVSFNLGEAITRSVPFCLSTATAILDALGQLFTGALGIRETLGGPVTTIEVTMSVAQSGFANILYLITMISVNLAVFNLLPIPALDGSKIIFTTIEWIRGKPINRTVENYIHVIGLLLLFTFVILLDIIKILT